MVCYTFMLHINLCLTVSRSAAKIQNIYNIETLLVLMHSAGQASVSGSRTAKYPARYNRSKCNL